MQKYHLLNKPDREITNESGIKEILRNGKYVTIAMCHDNEPYIVSLSYGYDSVNNRLYFHCSQKGLKLDFINRNPKVCATIIQDEGYLINECGHKYKTVVFWGTLRVVTELDEKKHGMQILLNHLENNPDVIKEKLLKSDEYYSKMEVLELDIIQIHGKAGS
jgi:nitroimidazol reductase NimA-like FMN-containing flavoprotein (pyridoxamine 5'-phosphate oxidase superfamily)